MFNILGNSIVDGPVRRAEYRKMDMSTRLEINTKWFLPENFWLDTQDPYKGIIETAYFYINLAMGQCL